MFWEKVIMMGNRVSEFCTLVIGMALLCYIQTSCAGSENETTDTDQCRKFAGFRALVVRPDVSWGRDYDAVVYAELLRHGMEVVYGEQDMLSSPETLSQFDIVATNVKRKFTAEQVAGVKAYLVQGGALYGSWGGPMDCPELLNVCGVKNTRNVNIKEMTLLDCPLTRGIGECHLKFPSWVGDGQWVANGKGERLNIAFDQLEGSISVGKDADGNCLGVLNEYKGGRMAVLGFGPENYKSITQDHKFADKLFFNLLEWLMPRGPKEHPFSNVIEINLPKLGQPSDRRLPTPAGSSGVLIDLVGCNEQ